MSQTGEEIGRETKNYLIKLYQMYLDHCGDWNDELEDYETGLVNEIEDFIRMHCD